MTLNEVNKMYDIGRLCVKIAGRDAGKKCVIVDVEGRMALIDGQTRRRKCNLSHLEPLDEVVKIKKGASNAEVAKALSALKIEVRATKPKKTPARPRKVRKSSLKEEKADEGNAKKDRAKKEKADEKKVEVKKESKPANKVKSKVKKAVKKEALKKDNTSAKEENQ